MCKAVEDYAERRERKGRLEGILEGKREGILEGKREGKLEGRLEGKFEDIKNMLREKISLETALRITGVDEETYNEYAAKERLQ